MDNEAVTVKVTLLWGELYANYRAVHGTGVAAGAHQTFRRHLFKLGSTCYIQA
jgi:hypothetical protein